MPTLPAPSALALAALLLAPQDPARSEHPWWGIESWVIALHQAGVPLRTWEEMRDVSNPQSALIILFGEAPLQSEQAVAVHRLIEKGAMVLVASDRATMDPWFRRYRVDFVPGPISTTEPGSVFQGAPDCPVAEVGGHPLFKDVHRIAFNKPAGFAGPGEGMIARLPPDAAGRRHGCIWIRSAPRTVLVSDHSIFINLMMSEEGNAAFARNLVRSYRAREAFFFFNGTLVHPGNLPTVFGAPEGLPSLAMVGPALRAIETSGMLQEFAARNAAFSIGMATIALTALGALAVLRARSKPIPGLDQPGPWLPDPASAGLRMVPRPDYRIATQELLRQWWKGWRNQRPLPSAEDLEAGRFEFADGTSLLDRWLGRVRIRRLARMTRRPPRLTLGRFQKLAARLRAFNAPGRIR